MALNYKKIIKFFSTLIIIIIFVSCGRKGDVKRINSGDEIIIPAKIDSKRTYKY